jgi:hypothetical protein
MSQPRAAKERIEELLPELHLVVLAGLVGFEVSLKALDQIEDLFGTSGRTLLSAH